MMSKEQKLEFLNAKLQLLAPHRDPAEIGVLQDVLEKVSKNLTALPQSGFNDLDREFDKLLVGHTSADAVASIRSELMKRFGRVSFRKSPDLQLATILKKGKVLNEVEAKTIEDHLNGDYGGYKLSESERSKLGNMLNSYESSRRSS